MNREDLFLGEPVRFWAELKHKMRNDPELKKINLKNLLLEISDLRSKVSFYESRIDEMNTYKEISR